MIILKLFPFFVEKISCFDLSSSVSGAKFVVLNEKLNVMVRNDDEFLISESQLSAVLLFPTFEFL